eukprot:6212061-Pleurochrysis_carterae.AAC.2
MIVLATCTSRGGERLQAALGGLRRFDFSKLRVGRSCPKGSLCKVACKRESRPCLRCVSLREWTPR